MDDEKLLAMLREIYRSYTEEPPATSPAEATTRDLDYFEALSDLLAQDAKERGR